jgi:carboxypeptidase Taq
MSLKEKLDAALRRQALLGAAVEGLVWDQEVMMPKAGAFHRAQVIGELSALHHQNLTQQVLPLVREALATPHILTPSEKAQLEILLQEAEPIEKIPTELVRRFSEGASQAQIVWAEARARSDFATFAPHLEKLVQLSREKAQYLGYEEEPYEALLRLYERSLRPRAVEALFAEIKDFLIQTIQACQEVPLAAQELPTLRMRLPTSASSWKRCLPTSVGARKPIALTSRCTLSARASPQKMCASLSASMRRTFSWP